MATAEVPCGLTRSISLVGNHCNKATQSDVSRTEWGREWCVGMTGGGRELFSDLQTKLLNAAVRERERVAARGLINTESTASSEWVILIQRHYHPAITLPIQPETSSAELLRLFFPLNHLRSWLPAHSFWMHKHIFCIAPAPQDVIMRVISAKCIISTGVALCRCIIITSTMHLCDLV